MISASIVLYHNDPKIFEPTICSFLDGTDGGLIWVSDNSDQPIKSLLFKHPRVRYFFNQRNLGFGAGHNEALKRISNTSEYHLFLNPDIEFNHEVLPVLLAAIRDDRRVGALMPKILYSDGREQYLAKLLPTPIDLLIRRFLPSKRLRTVINDRYELRQLETQDAVEVPTISGCFLLARTSILDRLQGFDERYFMYMEDFDLVRRIAQTHKILYHPSVAITHHYAKGSYSNKTLLNYHIKSAIKYFNKWGWIFDADRSRTNKKMLTLLKELKNG